MKYSHSFHSLEAEKGTQVLHFCTHRHRHRHRHRHTDTHKQTHTHTLTHTHIHTHPGIVGTKLSPPPGFYHRTRCSTPFEMDLISVTFRATCCTHVVNAWTVRPTGPTCLWADLLGTLPGSLELQRQHLVFPIRTEVIDLFAIVCLI